MDSHIQKFFLQK